MAIPSLALIPTGFKDGKLYSVLPESGAGDFDVVRGSGATRVNKDGLIELITDTNTPRLDYTDGGCPSLLLEPQSTNLVTYSEDFSQWSASGTPVVTLNYGVSPDGTQNGTRIEFDADERIRSNFSASGDFTFSVYLKGSGVITLRDNTNVHRQNVTLTSNWVRYDLSFNATITSVQIQNQNAGAVDCEIYGAQVEALPYATSYIPTSGAIATRLADAVAGAGDATTFNSTEGVLYAEATVENTGAFKTMIRLTATDTSTSDGLWIYARSNNQLQGVLRVGSVDQVALTSPLTYSGFVKVAFKYKENEFALWINGAEVVSDTSGAVFSANTLSKLGLKLGTNTNPFFGKVKDLRTYNTALTDAELLTLTTI